MCLRPWRSPQPFSHPPFPAVSDATLPAVFQGCIKVTSRVLSLDLPTLLLNIPKLRLLDKAETQRCPWLPFGPQEPGSSQVKEIKSSMYGKISATWDQVSPDQVEGQPVNDEGLEGSCSQGQVELETLPRGWAPHAVRAQGCSPQRTHLEERSAETGPGR